MKGPKETAGKFEAMPELGEAEAMVRQEETEALNERAASLETELASVYASTSWRLTAPVRGASRALRRLLRDTRRLLTLASWLGTGQFNRAAHALLPLYGRYVPLRVKEMIPERVREEVRRRLTGTEDFEQIAPSGPARDRPASLTRGRIASPQKVPIDHAKALYLERCELSVFRARTEGAIVFPREEHPYFSVVVCAYNKFPYNIRVLELLEHAASYAKAKIGIGVEVVFVDDGSSDETARLQNYVKGIVFDRVSPNGGFLKACNRGAALAKGSHLVFLNNDVEFDPDVFVRLHGAVERDKGEVACFGGAILQFDGSIQDLGSGIWRDGVAMGYFRDALPTRYAFAYPREVDYVGGCFFCISAADFREFGGFDALYSPGYYEESDLCLRLWKAGKRSRVYPDIRIYHLEYGTFSSGAKPRASASLMARNRVLFARRHREVLESRPPYAANAGYPARHSGARPCLLFLEDQVPSLRLGSGFGRSEIMIRALMEIADIEIFACFRDNAALAPDDFRYIETAYGPHPALLEKLLSSRHFDAVYVCRPHNLARYERVLRSWKAGGGKIVFDTEAICAVREAARLESAESYSAISASAQFLALVEKELRPAALADVFVVVNEFEGAIVREHVARLVFTVGHHLTARPLEPGAPARSGLLFVGALPGTRAPNYDSLLWFLDSVWPRVRAARPEESLRIAGFVGPAVTLGALKRPGVTCLGPVADLGGEYARARAFIAPTRFAAGLPFKVHEAMSYGLPVACSKLLYEQLAASGKGDAVALAATVRDDGREFAEACLRLLSDDALWSRQREAALAHIREFCSPDLLSAQVRDLMGGLGFWRVDAHGTRAWAEGPRGDPTAMTGKAMARPMRNPL